MHPYITHDNASAHYYWQAIPENARMHEMTRANIRKLMDEFEVPSERQLAMDCNMSQSTLNRFMKGDTDSLDFIHLQKLAHYFSLTVSQLIGETPFEADRKVRVVLLAMQQMPEYKKDMLVAASNSLTEHTTPSDPPRAANGH